MACDLDFLKAESILLNVHRLEGGKIHTVSQTGKQSRLELLRLAVETPRWLPDCAQLNVLCATCEQDLSRDATTAIETMQYASVYQACAAALTAAEKLLEPQQCQTCRRLPIMFLDWHTFVPPAKRDLVIRIFRAETGSSLRRSRGSTADLTYQLFWMNDRGEFSHVSHEEIPPIDQLSEDMRFLLSSASEHTAPQSISPS